jgi:hypothetical protein
MNPAKRKKLYRLELVQQKQEVAPVQQKIETIAPVVQETVSMPVAELEMGLKVSDSVESADSKKDKKKKSLTQES